MATAVTVIVAEKALGLTKTLHGTLHQQAAFSR